MTFNKCAPVQRYLEGPDVGRDSPSSDTLRRAFRKQVTRKQRRSDGTVSVEGSRFEIPTRYQHVETLHVQVARWDLTQVELIDPHTNQILCQIYPLDKSANASGKRRTRDDIPDYHKPAKDNSIAPLLEQYMEEYSATGKPPAYLPKEESQ